MKKRLSLLMAALMIITMLPMSAFAAVRPYTSGDTTVETDEIAKVQLTLEFDQYQDVKAGKVYFKINNAELAEAYLHDSQPTDNAPDVLWTRKDYKITDFANEQAMLDTMQKELMKDKYFAPVVAANAGTLDVTGTVSGADAAHASVATKVLGDNGEFVVTLAQKGKPDDGKDRNKMVIDFVLDTKSSNEGDITVDIRDLDKVGVGDRDGVKIATVKYTSKSLTVSARDDKKEVSYDGGSLSRVDIKNFDVKGMTFLAIELNRDDYYAFDKETRILKDGTAFDYSAHIDKDRYVILIPAGDLSGSKLLMLDTVLAKMGRSAVEGDVLVQVKAIKGLAGGTIAEKAEAYYKGSYTTIESDSVVIGKVVDYKVTMTVTEKGKKEIPSLWGGEEAAVEVTLKGPKGSFSNRGIEFEVKDAGVLKESIRVRKITPGNSKDVTVGGWRQDKNEKNSAVYKDGKFVITGVTSDTTELVFEMRIQTDHDKNGTATITAAQRGWETTADLAKVTPKFTISTKTTDMKKGEQKQTADVVITEAKEGLLRTNEKITLLFSTTRDYVEFAKVGKVEATNGMTFGSPQIRRVGYDFNSQSISSNKLVSPYERFEYSGKVPGGRNAAVLVELPIKKASKGGAAVITVSGIETRVDGSTVDSEVKIHSGLNMFLVASADYVKVVKEYGLEPVLTVFTIGQTQYTVNGMPKTAASAPYVKNGRTMLPVRALAESLGLHVQWNGATKTATFTDSTKVAAVVIGADTMYINGTPVKLSAKAEIVNGTTFIELRSLATVFGVQIDWDAAAKTATVSK